MTPSVARIVHYVSYGTPGGEYTSRCRAAVVTEVGFDNRLGLAVLNPTGLFFRSLAEGGCLHHDGDGKGAYPGGTWHWPERA